jgi:hypothetical protein
MRRCMTDDKKLAPRRVYSRPPVDGTEEDLDAWVDAFVEAALGLVPE